MIHFPTMALPDCAVLAGHARKKGGELVIVPLSPTVRRMRMAPGARDSRTHENARGMLRHVPRIGGKGVEICGARLSDLTFGREQRARHLIPRTVIGDLIPQPPVIRARCGFRAALAADHEEVAESHGPKVDKVLADEQAFDQLDPLLRSRRFAQELASLSRIR